MCQNFDDIDIFVYCGGKCGSTTLESTLINYNYKVFRAHSFADFTRLYNDKNIFDIINNNRQNKEIYIIDSYRTPIERKISSFFENINTDVPNYRNLSDDEINSIINDKINILEEYQSIDELFDYFNMEKFTSFDFNKKYNIRKEGNINFIKIRFNDIGNWANILSEIFQKNIILKNENLSHNKATYELYNNCRNKYRVSKKYLDENLANDKNFKIYNSIDEQLEYITKWKNKSINL